ncbi:hypothetical protein BDP27DRAFT_1421866 [Rhodocollybia butyracea]|uniref:Transposase n=1 Tax=Rhodocollybia butyracea TaxID=206335 RepID=A0A9P5PMG7_9AGAR|nr:hypothetical protein BDP27DRAFT_1421866 [Rhodocollybia butyracea]
MSSVFEPAVVLKLLKSREPKNKQDEFVTSWNNEVEKRMQKWITRRNQSKQSVVEAQLCWESHIVAYVKYVAKIMLIKKTSLAQPSLPLDVPLLGPRFTPPTYLHLTKRSFIADIQPEAMLLKPLNVIHPFYYPEIADCCPRCNSKTITWDGWTTYGSCAVHGIDSEESALGYQLRCQSCAEGKQNMESCFATTSPIFWEKMQGYEIPRGIPHFFQRCALTRPLYDMILELCLSGTSGGLAENIEQLHIAEYFCKHQDYLRYYQLRPATPMKPLPLLNFPDPKNDCISSDIITQVLLQHYDQTGKDESAQYLQTIMGRVLSLDHTFRAASKASIASSSHERSRPISGGTLSIINEKNQILSWRFCLTQSVEEISEALTQLKIQYRKLGEEDPDEIIVDNCCTVRPKISKVFPNTHVGQDVHHVIQRYTGGVLNGTKNPHAGAIASEVSHALLKTHAADSANGVTEYRTKDEQGKLLEEMYQKWAEKGCWNASAAGIHQEQMKHVARGCLTRTRQDICSDGSCIEGSHKGWNSLQRSFASGLPVMNALCTEFVLRRNIRMGLKNTPEDLFLKSTFGSHRIRLVASIASLTNKLIPSHPILNRDAHHLPELPVISSSESFGLVRSENALTFEGLFKMEEDEDDAMLFASGTELNSSNVSVKADNNESLEVVSTSHSRTLASNGKRKASEISASPVEFPETSPTKRACTAATVASALATVKKKPDHSFFASFSSSSTSAKAAPVAAESSKPSPSTTSSTSPTSASSTLAQPLPLPSGNTTSRQSRSEYLFSRSTGVNPEALHIKTTAEFHLFMDMCAEGQWVSYSMTPRKWAVATIAYNERLQQKDPSAIRKLPRALLGKLGDIEKTISECIAVKNFKSKRGSTTFWTRHCEAVSLVQVKGIDSTRKPQTCGRCQTIMYPFVTGHAQNHKRGYCSDGVKQVHRAIPFPQPVGIFVKGV